MLTLGCNNSNNGSVNKTGKIILPKTLKDAVLYTVVPRESVYREIDGVPNADYYYYYKNRDEIKQTLSISDSMRIEKLSVVFYTFKINGQEFYNTSWFLNIDGYYLPKGMYISQYGDNEEFSNDNQELAKAIGKKIDAWEKKTTKKWW